MTKHRLGIVVPYRNRYAQLYEFKQSIQDYLRSTEIDYRIIVVEQDDAKLFNRGKLLNIGFLEAKKLKCDYVCFHDVDMLPSKVDYGYSDVPIHLATTLTSSDNKNKPIFDQYFGGVTIFPVELFEKINGYSNNYWGWGFEDDDLLWRCLHHNLPCDTTSLKNSGPKTASLKFNGLNSHVEIRNTIDFKEDFTIFLSYQPEHIEYDTNKRDDFFTAFGIPGYDFNIGWNSFNRYKVEFFNKRKKYFQLYSDEDSMKKVTITVTYSAENKKIEAFLNGKTLGKVDLDTSIMDYSKAKFMYLGTSDPTREKEPKFFKGKIDSLAIFKKKLDYKEKKTISENRYFGLTSNFEDYNSASKLITYYDGKFIKGYRLMDLSGKHNTGVIKDCEIVPTNLESNTVIPRPYRRNSRFKLLDHTDEGFSNDSWKDLNTRYNQLRFNNEVKQNWHNPDEDGLNTVDFKLHSNNKGGKVTHLIVGI